MHDRKRECGVRDQAEFERHRARVRVCATPSAVAARAAALSDHPAPGSFLAAARAAAAVRAAVLARSVHSTTYNSESMANAVRSSSSVRVRNVPVGRCSVLMGSNCSRRCRFAFCLSARLITDG